MGDFFRTPVGLLDLLGTKVGGRYPKNVADSVATTIPIEGMILAGTLASEVKTLNTSTLGTSIVHEVPVGERWGLISVGCDHNTLLTTDLLSFGVQLTELPEGPSTLDRGNIAYFPGRVSVALTLPTQSQLLPQTIWLAAGVKVTARVTESTAAALTWSNRIMFYRLRD